MGKEPKKGIEGTNRSTVENSEILSENQEVIESAETVKEGIKKSV